MKHALLTLTMVISYLAFASIIICIVLGFSYFIYLAFVVSIPASGSAYIAIKFTAISVGIATLIAVVSRLIIRYTECH